MPVVAFCKDKFTVPPGATVAEEEIVLPGAGVPEQAATTGGVHLRILPFEGIDLVVF